MQFGQADKLGKRKEKKRKKKKRYYEYFLSF